MVGAGVLAILALVAAFAYYYWQLSSHGLHTAFQEGEKLKAVNLAESGLNYAVAFLNDAYYRRTWPVRSPSLEYPKIRKEFENGSFIIDSMEPLRKVRLSDSVLDREYSRLPYRNSFGKQSGYYDIYRVNITARMKSSGVTVRLEAFVKTIQLEGT